MLPGSEDILMCLAHGKFACVLGLAAAVCWGSLVHAQEAESAVRHAEAEIENAARDPARSATSDSDPMSVDPDLAIWTAVVFVVLLIVLSKFAWRPLLGALESREHTIHEHLAAAERSHDAAKALLAEYERKLASASEEVKAMLDEARRDAEHTQQQILVEARAGADAERARALRDVEAATDVALKQIAERSTNLAIDLAGKIVGSKLSAADHNRLISEAVGKFTASSPSQN